MKQVFIVFNLFHILTLALACNQKQFGKTCSLPLGANCPWKTPISVPLMYILSYNKTLQSGNVKLTIIKVGNQYNSNSSPICQVIFPFPKAQWLSLEKVISSQDYATLVNKMPPESSTGKVNDITNIHSITATTDDPGFVRTYIGKVANSYGYYIYNSPNRQYWPSIKKYLYSKDYFRSYSAC